MVNGVCDAGSPEWYLQFLLVGIHSWASINVFAESRRASLLGFSTRQPERIFATQSPYGSAELRGPVIFFLLASCQSFYQACSGTPDVDF